MATVSSIVMVSADATTVADVIEWAQMARKLGAQDNTVLVDGGHTRAVGYSDEAAPLPGPNNLSQVETWLASLAAAGITPETPLTAGGLDLALDLTVDGIEQVGCGDCTEGRPTDLLIHLHTACADTWNRCDVSQV